MTTVQGQKVKGQGHKVTHKTCTFTHNVVLNCEARATAARVAARRRVVARQARRVFAQRFTFIDVCARANTNQQTGLSTPAYDTIRYDTIRDVVVVVVLLYGLVSTRLQHSKNIHSCVASQ